MGVLVESSVLTASCWSKVQLDLNDAEVIGCRVAGRREWINCDIEINR